MYTNKLSIPSKSYSPVYMDDRMRDPWCVNVRHTESCEIVRFHTQKDAGEYQDHLARQGYILHDTKVAVEVPEPQRYIVVRDPGGLGVLVIDVYKRAVVTQSADTPYNRRKARRYLTKLNEQEVGQ